MTAEKTLVSDHAKKDRIDRLTACLTTIGYNDFALIVEDTKAGYERMPNGMYKKIVRNNEKYKELLNMQRQLLTL